MIEKLVLKNTPVWDRQPGETAMQFMWFGRYRDARLEGGSIAEIRRKYDKKLGYEKVLRIWSSKNRWVERIEAYRDYLEAEKQRKRLRDIEDMGERQAKNGVLLQQYGIAWFAAHPDIGKEADGITPEMAVRFIEIGSRIERTARGAPTEIRVDAELPEETRKRMEALYAEAMEEDEEVVPENLLEKQDNEEEQEPEEI
jgi:hypothetical protein